MISILLQKMGCISKMIMIAAPHCTPFCLLSSCSRHSFFISPSHFFFVKSVFALHSFPYNFNIFAYNIDPTLSSCCVLQSFMLTTCFNTHVQYTTSLPYVRLSMMGGRCWVCKSKREIIEKLYKISTCQRFCQLRCSFLYFLCNTSIQCVSIHQFQSVFFLFLYRCCQVGKDLRNICHIKISNKVFHFRRTFFLV